MGSYVEEVGRSRPVLQLPKEGTQLLLKFIASGRTPKTVCGRPRPLVEAVPVLVRVIDASATIRDLWLHLESYTPGLCWYVRWYIRLLRYVQVSTALDSDYAIVCTGTYLLNFSHDGTDRYRPVRTIIENIQKYVRVRTYLRIGRYRAVHGGAWHYTKWYRAVQGGI